MPEVSRWVSSGKILTLFINEGVFDKLKNRLGMISGGQKYKAHETQVMEGSSTFCGPPLYHGRFRSRKRMRNVRLHARHYHLCYVLSTQRWVPDTEVVIIPRKISIISPQVSPTSRGKAPKAPPLWRILWRNWRDRTTFYLKSLYYYTFINGTSYGYKSN